MTATLFRSARPVTLIGGGPVAAPDLAAALALAPEVVAADGGADTPLPPGHRLQAVIGDLDSLRDPEALRARGVPLHRIPEQITTDLDKCLRSIAAPLVIGLGFLGGRLDHQLAALNSAITYPAPPLLLLGGADLCFRLPGDFAIDLPAGTRLSLFPLSEARGTRSTGLRWPVDGLVLAPGGRIGTSNETTGGRVRIGFAPAHVLAILPAAFLAEAAAALVSPRDGS